MFFKRKKSPIDAAKRAVEEVEKTIGQDKEDRAVAVQENEQAREHTKNLLRRNGFTLTLFLAVHNPGIKRAEH